LKVFKKVRRMKSIIACRLLIALSIGLGHTSVQAQSGLDSESEIKPFAAEVARDHGVDEHRVREILADAKILPNVLAAMSRPAEGKAWREYRPIFLTEKRITGGVAFWKKHADLLVAARAKFNVPEEMIVAIIGVETFYGRRAGNIRVLDALATLGFRFPRRAAFFRRELGHFMVLAQSENLDVMRVNGSYAGAMGIPQFIPSSYREYAVDFDGDGRRDLINNVADAIGSVAAYFSRHGWGFGQPVTTRVAALPAIIPENLLNRGLKPYSTVEEFAAAGVQTDESIEAQLAAALISLDGDSGKEYWLGFKNFYVITRYNRSPLYAMAAHQLAQAIAKRRNTGD
jgi:membrane-bound lytic murein transglycosylase B